MRLRARLALAAIVLPIAAVAPAACFPDYAIGTAATEGGAPADGKASDVTVSEGGAGDGGGSDGAANDGTSPGNDASSGSDGSGGVDASDAATTGGDAGVVDNVATLEGGTFAIQVDNASMTTIDASVRLDYTIAVDRTEVTVGKFQAWLDAGMPVPADGTQLDPHYPSMTWDATSWNAAAKDTNYSSKTVCNGPGGDGPTYTAGNPSLPMNCVTWEQSLAFCWWDHHRRLLTDAEWRIVASSGGTKGPFPWGTLGITCFLAIHDDGTFKCGWPVDAGSTVQGETPAGVLDIVGSLSEWLWDYLPGTYAFPADAGTDYPGPTFPGGANHRVWIGGDWETNLNYVFQVNAAADPDSSPEENFDNTGWRCASSQ